MQINRRNFLLELSGLVFCILSACSQGKSRKEKRKGEPDMELRPHHILDIVSDHGQDIRYTPHAYGHSLHIVAPRLLLDPGIKIRLVVGADAVCEGCMHLLPDGRCADVLAQLHPSPSKQAYNDVLDCRLLDLLEIEQDSVMTVRKYLQVVNAKVPGIEEICTHPKENREERLAGLMKGLVKLGIRG